MRAFLIRSSIITGFIVLLLSTIGVALALFAPCLPGSVLFPVQNFAEQQMKIIYRDKLSNSNYLLDLVGRRVNDLGIRQGTKFELISLQYLDKSIDRATVAISLVSQEQNDDLRLRLFSLAQSADDGLLQLTHVPFENHDVYISFQSKISVLLQMLNSIDITKNVNSKVSAVSAGNQQKAKSAIPIVYSAHGLIPFPPGSTGAVHAFYALIGEHAALSCKSCHNSGKYVSTPDKCILCHILKQPIPHYIGECELCHTSISWTDVHFDHNSAAAEDCVSCHDRDKPAEHYNGQCSACHITQNWNQVTFDHAVAGAVDCISCHAKVAPANHFGGQCSNCHNTSNWTSVIFDHSGFNDCISCHASVAPSNHYSGQCSNCHETSGSWANAHFNHSGFTDCVACHAGAAPGNHFSGQCSNCHNPNSSWSNASFDHSGNSDCIACHAGSAPGNHYSGQCSDCHGTTSWSGAGFNHSGFSDCISCHLKDRPDEHDNGQCSNCHNTQRWGDGGDSGGLGIMNNGELLSVSCSSCHQPNIVALVAGSKQ